MELEINPEEEGGSLHKNAHLHESRRKFGRDDVSLESLMFNMWYRFIVRNRDVNDEAYPRRRTLRSK
jgi:hypothetical protein